MQIYRGAASQIDRRATDLVSEQEGARLGRLGHAQSRAHSRRQSSSPAGTFLVGFLILRYTRLGLYVFAIGGNEIATRFSGVRIDRYKIAVYTFMGLCAGIAAIMLTSRLNSAKADFATGEELNAIAAVVIGGTSLFGGEGTLVGTMIGALLMAVIRNGLTLMHISAFYQQIVIGAVIILAVLIDRLRRRGEPEMVEPIPTLGIPHRTRDPGRDAA